MEALVDRLKAALADRYVIERELGQGGMATVYLAHDLRHDRQVAVKVLKPELAAVIGAERFLQEIRVTAHLQHPHILPLFDSGEAHGFLFYVMPYVEGESLRDRLTREKQLPVEEAIQISTAVASALDYAHRHKVIHRDIKPENILLHDGQPVVADFGIALAVSVAGGHRITETGLSLGTPQYMSPEQATADRELDGRTDIYSLGCVLYEMLAGEPPHIGTTVQAVIAKVLTDEPRSVRLSRPAVPAHLGAAVHKALEKLPADRFATAAQFAAALEERVLPPPRAGATALAGAVGARPQGSLLHRLLSNRRTAIGALVVAAVALGGLALERWRASQADELLTVRFVLALPGNQRIWDATNGRTLAISPKGDRIAYTAYEAGYTLYLREADQLEPKLLVDNTPARNLTFSPDGRWVAFTAGAEVRKVSIAGGPVITLGSVPGGGFPFGLSWGTASQLVVGSSSGMMAIPATGGTPRRLTQPDSAAQGTVQWWPLALADGETVVYAAVGPTAGGPTAGARIGVASLRTGHTTVLNLPGTFPLGIVGGRLIYAAASGVLWAVPFDARRVRVNGEPAPVIEDLVTDALGGAQAALSASGTMVYLSGRSESQPVLVDRRGGPVPLLNEARALSAPRFSPDGERLAIEVQSTSADIWVFDQTKRTLTRLTTEGNNSRPEWTPDGKRILFRSDRGGRGAIWWQPADGSGPAELLLQPEREPWEAVLSPDGRWLVYRTAPAGGHSQDIFAVPLQGDRKPVPLAVSPFVEVMPRLSSDGRWLAYRSNESGRNEIYVRPFPGAGARALVSTDGGDEPLWAPDGRTLFYRNGADVIAVSVTTGGGFSIGPRAVVRSGDYLAGASHQNWDVAPDGIHFLMLKRAGEEAQVIVVQNWARELRTRTAAEAGR